jgi:hypothetical protein
MPVSVPSAGKYRVLLRGAFAGNLTTVESRTLGLSRTLELRSSPVDLQYFTKDSVYTADRVPVDTSRMTVPQLETATASGDLIPVNISYQYQDLGVVEASKAGSHTISLAKTDTNPLLVEGIVLVPEAEYQQLTHTPATNLVTPDAKLECGQVFPVFGPNSEGYVDPAANGPHKDLSNEELLTLAAAGVSSIAPDESGGLGADWLVLILAAGLMLSAVLTVLSRTRARPEELLPASAVPANATTHTTIGKDQGDQDV